MDHMELLDTYGVEGTLTGNEYLTLCPFHSDTTPSCAVNIEKGVFKCFACDAQGDIVAFIAGHAGCSRKAVEVHMAGGQEDQTNISHNLIVNWHRELCKNKQMLAILKTKGITKKEVEKYLIGYDSKRITIPIYNRDGKPINVRRYLPNASKAKFLNMKGCGGAALYPIDSLEHDNIIITEGELKAVLLIKLGFNAISATGGSKTWPQELSPHFKDKKVWIVYDIDTAGRSGAMKLAASLYIHTKHIHIVNLKLDEAIYPKGDITNYFVDTKHSVESFKKLLTAAELWKPVVEDKELDTKEYNVSLHEATDAKYYNKIVKTEVVVSAKDTAPYMIPFKCEVKCTKDKEYCAFCKRVNATEFIMDKTSPHMLELVGVSTQKLANGLKKIAGIPKSCDTCRFKVLSSVNVEEVRLMPQLKISTDVSEQVVRQAFYIGHNIDLNTGYTIKARVCPKPDTQYATLVIYEAEPVVDALQTFELKSDLTVFQPKEWTVESLEEKLTEIYEDLSANVTRIYKRQDLHLFYDLVYHSPLYITFQEKQIKGWIEGLVLGDSGQGKSETIAQLQKHYGIGEKVDVKSATTVGLLGGLQESAKRWFVTWGIIPLNDKRLVVLEEVKGISEEIISKLTEVRSSGIAEISKIEKARTNARTRLIWISNPRSDRQVLSYNFGVEAIKELIGNLEDIRRFDFAIVVTSMDVSRKWLNISSKDRPCIKHWCTKELCQALILWAWSRNNVDFEEDAIEEVLSVSKEMGGKYSSRIPLVEAADQRLKIARLSAALAARTFSHNKQGVLVRKCHVEYIHGFLNKLYSNKGCGYDEFSRMINSEQVIHEPDEIKQRLRDIPYSRDTVRALLDSTTVSVFDFVDWTELELDECRTLIGTLVRKNALKRGKRNYMKTPAFIAMLKELRNEGLTNETAYTQSESEDF